ncbi:sigma-70 family RNA polymerase sigma factor [Pseudoteredinibacter isoporae]
MPNNELNFESVIKKYRLSLIKIAATFEADVKLQQDLLQEMSLAIWQALPRFQGKSSLHTFVYRVAYNQALNHISKYSSIHHQQIDDSFECDKNTPEQQLQSDQSFQYMLNNIRLLPVVQRQLIALSLEGISYSDISEITGLTEGNVGVQLNRAKNKLKKLMEKRYV